MQADVIDILTAADNTGRFETIRDRDMRDFDSYPAFVVTSRRKILQPANTGYTAYNGPWRYEILILREEDDAQAEDISSPGADFADLQEMVGAFLGELLGDGDWEADEDIEFGNLTVISGVELIGARLFVQRHRTDRF